MKKTYRDLLKDIYLLRKRRNPSYSVVAFSRDAGFKSYHMSDILSGRYGLSTARAVKVAESLKMNAVTKEEFLALVAYESAKSPIDRQLASAKLESFTYSSDKSITAEEFSPISRWFYLAVLEVLRKYEECPSPTEIARKLGISDSEAKDALEKLQAMGVVVNEPGNFAVRFEMLSIKTQPSDVIRAYHREMIHKALKSIDEHDYTERCLGSVNVLLTEEEYKNFTVELASFVRKNAVNRQKEMGDRPRLYAVNTQIIPLEAKV